MRVTVRHSECETGPEAGPTIRAARYYALLRKVQADLRTPKGGLVARVIREIEEELKR
jgi:hypothetical protein